jgi:hypothetical protein
MAKRQQAFNRFIALALIAERRANNLAAWEGIRIVRERVE